MSGKIYVGDIGTVIVADCGQDISDATARKIEVYKPDKTSITWNAVASGTDSIAYTTQSGDLDLAGTWKVQAHVTTPAGQWLGETAQFTVTAAFK